jgi:hypothetical protein
MHGYGKYLKKKVTISFVMSVRLSVRMEYSASTGRIIMKIDLSTFRKSVVKIQLSLKSGNNNKYFT